MAKLKDGFYKQTAEAIGSDLYVLLAGGGSKLLSDFAYKTDLSGFVTGGPYLPLSGGNMNNAAVITFTANGTLRQTTATTSNATSIVEWYKGTTKDSNYTHPAQIGWHNTGDTDGAIYLVPYPTSTDPWASSVGLYIGKTALKWNNQGIIHSGNIGSQSVNYATSAGSANTATSATSANYSRNLLGKNTSGTDYSATDGNLIFAEWNTHGDNRWYLKAKGYETRVGYASDSDKLDGIDSTGFLRKVNVANNAENDFNSFDNLTLTGRGDPTTGASLKNAPWTGSGPAGGYGTLTYLWSGYGTQMAWGYNSNRIYIRNKYYSSGATWSSTWDSLALTSDLKNPTDYYWANVPISATSNSSTSPTFANATTTGLLTVSTGASHCGIKAGNTYINSINSDLILQNNGAIRFGPDSWDYNYWAGLKYVHSSKTISLGLADGSVFTANGAQSGGTMQFPGINKFLLNGVVHVNSGSPGQFNDGIRLYGSAKESSWSNINFGCDPSAASGTHAKQWMIGRNTSNNFMIGAGSNYANNQFEIDTSGNVGIKGTTTAKGSIYTVQPSTNRRVGIIGSYDPNRAAAIWSMGSSYQIAADGTTLGNLYGAAYVYYGSGYTFGAGKSGGHSFVWAQNGTPCVALGDGLWTRGGLTVEGNQTLYGLTSICNAGNSASYGNAAMQIREYNFGGAQTDTWGNAPRLAWNWSGRVQAQIGLSSDNHLYISEDGYFTNPYEILHAGSYSRILNGIYLPTTQVSKEQASNDDWIKTHALATLRGHVHNTHNLEWQYLFGISSSKTYGSILRTTYGNGFPRLQVMGLNNGTWTGWREAEMEKIATASPTPTSVGWYRCAHITTSNATNSGCVLISLQRGYNSPQNEHYIFAISIGYNGQVNISQLSGCIGGQRISKVRVVWNNSGNCYFDYYMETSNYTNGYRVRILSGDCISYQSPTLVSEAGGSVTEFSTVNGMKSNYGFTGDLYGNATSASKLTTVSKTAWGQTYWTDGGVPTSISGNMTGVGSITMNGAINYAGSKATYPMIKFIDNTSNGNGNGIAIGGGGTTIIGGGEAGDLFISAGAGGNESLILASDTTITLYTNCQDGTSKAKSVSMDTNGYLNTSYIYYGGHEKNASNPSYVAGFNSSDKYIRSYATSSLIVKHASTSDSATQAKALEYKYLPSSVGNGSNTVWCKFARISFNAAAWCNAAGYFFFSGAESTDHAGILSYHFRSGSTSTAISIAILEWLIKNRDTATVIAEKVSDNVYDLYINNYSSYTCPIIHHMTVYPDRFTWNVGSWSTTKPTASYTSFDSGRVSYATTATTSAVVGDGSITMIPQYNNEVNFGGSNTSTTIYFGYRAAGSKAIPTQFIFGGSTGTAAITAGQFIANNSSGPHFTGTSAAGNWAYLRLNNSSCLWDIATRSDSGSGGLWLSRYSGGDNGIFVSASSTPKVGINTSSPSEALSVNGWVGTIGNTGWYSITHGGGMYMSDSTWVRTYNSKSFYCSADIQAGGRIYTGYDSGVSNSISCSNWFRSNGNTGWYNPTNECYVYPNNISSYGGLILRGVKSGYHGFLLGTSTGYMNLMDNGTDKGLYQENQSMWILYYNASNKYVGIRTSSLSYPLTINGDSYTNGWSRAANGFYVHDRGVHFSSNGTKGQIAITSNNEFEWAANGDTLYFNYAAVGRGTTVTTYRWHAGSSTSYASHILGKVKAQSSASSWLDGQRYERGGFNLMDATDTDSYWPWMRQTNTGSSKWFSMGVLGSSLYFIGSATSRTENSYDYGFRMDFSNGYLYGNFSGYLSGTAYSAEAIKDSNNGTRITACYSTGGFSSNPSWLAAWNGYHLTYVSPSVLNVAYATSAGSATTAGRLSLTSCYGTTSNSGLWSTIKTSTSSYLGTATVYEVYNNGGPDTYGEVLDIVSVHNNHWQPQLWFGSGKEGRLRYRNKNYNDNSWGDWKTVAWTSEIPSVGNGTVTITQNGVNKGSFTMNQSGDITIALTDTDTDTNTWRTVQCNGTSIGSNTLNLKAGTNVSLSNSSGAITITATDTNYYPTRVYTSGFPISSYVGSTDCALYVPYASLSQAGVVDTSDQSFNGNKTFTKINSIDPGYLLFYAGRVYKKDGSTSASATYGMYGFSMSVTKLREGAYQVKITNNTGKSCYIHPMLSPVFANKGVGSCYEHGFAYFSSGDSYMFPTSVSSGSTLTFTIICGYLHTQTSWSTNDFTKSNDGGGFICELFATWSY